MRLRDRAVLFLSTGGFIGHIPFAPGTFGSFVGLPICYILSGMKMSAALLFAGIFICLAVWLADVSEKILDKKDPGCIVVDEMAGLMVALIGLPFSLFPVVLGFFIFRALDIVKPFPIRILEKLSGGSGIVADDVMAGIYSNFILRGVLVCFPGLSGHTQLIYY